MNEPNTPEVETPEIPAIEVLPNTTETNVSMTQAQLDSLIRSKMGLAGRQAKEDAEKLRIENERLKQAVSGKGSEDQLEVLKGQLAEERLKNQAVLDESIKRQRDLLISQEAAANNHVDLDTTLRLTRGNLRHDPATGGFTVLDDTGNPRLNENSDPMTISEFFKDFSSKKLHLVRGQVVPGAGGVGSSGSTLARDPGWAHFVGPNSSARDANILCQTAEGKRRYADYKRQARAAGAIQ